MAASRTRLAPRRRAQLIPDESVVTPPRFRRFWSVRHRRSANAAARHCPQFVYARHTAEYGSGVSPRMASPLMIGHERKLNALADFARGWRPGLPSVALVSGRAGMGKTRLVSEAMDRWQAQKCQVLLGRCVPVEGMPYTPLVSRRTRLRPGRLPRRRAAVPDHYRNARNAPPLASAPTSRSANGAPCSPTPAWLAIVDRVTFNARILETGTESYRLRTSRNSGRRKRAS